MSDELEASRWSFRSNYIQEWPLTTTYTPPSDCTSVFEIYPITTTPPTAEVTIAYHGQTSCWVYPSKSLVNVFTPGLVCPHGHTPALTKLNSKLYLSSGWTEYTPTGASEVYFSKSQYYYLVPDETMVLCCPSHYTIHVADGYGHYCQRTITSGVVSGYLIDTYRYDYTTTTAWRWTTATSLVPLSLGPTPNTLDYPGANGRTTLNGPITAKALLLPYQIMWRKSDESLVSDTTFDNPTNKDPTGIAAPTAPTTTVPDLGAIGTGSSGLPTGAVIGIAVGSAAVAMLLLAVVYLLFKLRRKQMRQAGVMVAEGETSYGGKSDVGGTPRQFSGVQQQLPVMRHMAIEVADTGLHAREPSSHWNRGPSGQSW